MHVNQHVIRSNTKNGTDEPALTVKTYKSNQYAHEVLIHDADGNVVAKVVSRPSDPLSCGARVWIESLHTVTTVHRAEQGPVSDDPAEAFYVRPHPDCCCPVPSNEAPCPVHGPALREATEDETQAWLAGHLVIDGAVESEHNLLVPA